MKVDSTSRSPSSITLNHPPTTARLVTDVDVPEENIATMLTYLELSPTRSWIKVKQPVNATCFIQCYGGPAHLTALAKQVCYFEFALYQFWNGRTAGMLRSLL